MPLATLTLYRATDTITSSLLPYWAHSHVPGAGISAGDPSPVPTAVTIFGAISWQKCSCFIKAAVLLS